MFPHASKLISYKIIFPRCHSAVFMRVKNCQIYLLKPKKKKKITIAIFKKNTKKKSYEKNILWFLNIFGNQFSCDDVNGSVFFLYSTIWGCT